MFDYIPIPNTKASCLLVINLYHYMILFLGVVNNAFLTDGTSIAGSRKSLNLQPILVVGSEDAVSQFSTNNRFNRPEFHNFQL